MSGDTPSTRPVSEVKEPTGTIVVADDDRMQREQLSAILRSAGHTVELCEDGQEAVSRVAQGGVDVVLLDVMMPKLSGTDACKLLKSAAGTAHLPVLLVTSRNDLGSRVEGLRIGADDYIGKPFDPAELLARVATALRTRRMFTNISDDRDRLARRAAFDELTGLPNRRLLETRIHEERKRAERHHEPFTFLLVGLAAAHISREPGATERIVLRGATAVKRSVREGDVVARFAPTVIGALLPHTHFVGAIAAAERIHRDVVMALGEGEDSVALGAALFPSRDARTVEALISAAEAALDEAWLEGGGQLCILQQRRYLYTPSFAAPPRSERATTHLRRFASEPPPPPPPPRRSPSDPPASTPRPTVDTPPASARKPELSKVRPSAELAPPSTRFPSVPPPRAPLDATPPSARRPAIEPARPPLDAPPPSARRPAAEPARQPLDTPPTTRLPTVPPPRAAMEAPPPSARWPPTAEPPPSARRPAIEPARAPLDTPPPSARRPAADVAPPSARKPTLPAVPAIPTEPPAREPGDRRS